MAEVEAFHVDRGGAVTPGMVLGFDPGAASMSMPAGVPRLVDEWPDGITRHGVQYALSANFDGSTTPEWIFELVRRAEFPDMPSRFQSVFATESLAAARTFRHVYGGNLAVPIVRVRGECLHRANLALIRLNAPAVANLGRAREYWRGEAGVAVPPLWELLLAPPVTVIGPVDEAESS